MIQTAIADQEQKLLYRSGSCLMTVSRGTFPASTAVADPSESSEQRQQGAQVTQDSFCEAVAKCGGKMPRDFS